MRLQMTATISPNRTKRQAGYNIQTHQLPEVGKHGIHKLRTAGDQLIHRCRIKRAFEPLVRRSNTRFDTCDIFSGGDGFGLFD